MGKTSFQSLDQLAKNITDTISRLNNGQLNSSEIEDLTENARGLYERLVVIRHKAYEKFEKSAEPIKKVAEVVTPVKEDPIEAPIFDFAAEEPAEVVTEANPEVMAFDFSESVEKEVLPEEPEKVVEEILTETHTVTIEEKIEVEHKTTTSLADTLSSQSTSLNDAFKSSNSLGDKLNQSKIEDLKSYIGINKKFSFISDLFNGSNEAYNDAITSLNSCENGDEARNILSNLAQKNSWNVEGETLSIFIDIVERRYL